MPSVLRPIPPADYCAGTAHRRDPRRERPAALMIACPDAYFDDNPLVRADEEGLLVLHAAANEVPPYDPVLGDLSEAIERAVAGAGTGDIIVCGHTCCSALKLRQHEEAKRSGKSRALAGVGGEAPMDRILRNVRASAALRALAEENVLAQLDTLRTYPTVAAAIACGEVRLHGWLYLHEAGLFLAYDAAQGRFAPFSECCGPAPT